MDKAWTKLTRIAVTGILFLLLACGARAEGKALTAACPSRCGVAVAARLGGDGYILSLPGFWDLTKVTIELEGYETVLLDGGQVAAGTETNLSGFAGRKVPLKTEDGRVRENLTILQGSAIPALFLEVDAEGLGQVNHSKDHVLTEGRAVYTEADGTVSYDGALTQLKGRGNNTFRYRKKPYQLKLAEKAALSGMRSGKTWVLLANWTDVSQLRNRIMLDMSRAIGLRNALHCVHADIWINGNYQGLYLVTEKIQVGRERIPITNLEKATAKANPSPLDPGKMSVKKAAGVPLLRSYPAIADPEDITGGYIFTMEKFHRMRDTAIAGFRTAEGLSIRIKEPTCPSKAQAEYLYGRVSEMQRALIAEDGIEPETGKAYGEYLDVTSFAQRFLLEDWCRNYDLLGGSQYMYKDSDAADPLIYAGPSWDYDLSFGNMKDKGYSPRGAWAMTSRNRSNLWWLLGKHGDFLEQAGGIWRSVFRPAVAVLLGEAEGQDGPLKSLDAYRREIEDSVTMNYRRWPVSDDATAKDAGGSFDNALNYLRQWITERTAWMDEQYPAE